MKYSYYPGCTLKNKAKDLDAYARASAKALGFEMEEIEENLILPSFRKLRFVDINKPFWKKLMYRAFSTAQKHCDTWHDYEMDVTPYENSKPIYYESVSYTHLTLPTKA